MGSSPTTDMGQVLQWIIAGVYWVESDGCVYKRFSNLRRVMRLTARIHKRKGSERGDPRVDLWHDGMRRSCNVSHLAWMQASRQQIPDGFEIHHIDNDPLNNAFDNLLCVHALDHVKLHASDKISVDETF